MSEWELILKWMPKMLQGAALTLELLAIAVVAGLALALPLGIARASRHWYVRAVPYAYIFFFRGIHLRISSHSLIARSSRNHGRRDVRGSAGRP